MLTPEQIAALRADMFRWLEEYSTNVYWTAGDEGDNINALCDMALASLEAAKQGEAQPPASQGGVIEAAWREAAQFALGRFGALGKDNIGVGVENTVSNLRARKQHQAALSPSVNKESNRG